MIRLVFLGTSAAIPSPDRNLSSIAIQKDGSVYLFDCGEGTQRQMMRYGVSYEKVVAIFITHLHLDHFLGIFGLLETRKLKGRTEKIKIFGPPGTKNLFEKEEYVEVFDILRGGKVYSDKGFCVFAFRSNHGLKYSFGYIFQESEKIRFIAEKAHAMGLKGPMFSQILQKGKLKVGNRTILLSEISYKAKGKCIVYTGDTKPLHRVPQLAKNADIIIHDATYSVERSREARERNHSTSADAARFAKKAKSKLLILTHISGRYPNPTILEDEAKRIFKNSRAAYDGMEILL
ncbi:MAG: ribonuclease Z [Candidatus Anstonellales archaeon]